jgi:CO/xanthine dehydrogenase Mo-binding subunit
VVAGNAIHAAAKAVRVKILKLASKVLETPEEELELKDGYVCVADIPRQSISLGELAALANPLRGAVEPGTEPGLEATDYFGPQYGATAFGTHAMILEVDPETMMVDIKRYVAVEDCGTMLNPLIVEGQVHGGVALGISNSYYEQLIYDENAQLLNASFADYLIPTASEVPRVEVGHEETRAPLNPLGTKGAGEAGCIVVPALFAQALDDALADFDVEILEVPMSPNKLFELLQAAERET